MTRLSPNLKTMSSVQLDGLDGAQGNLSRKPSLRLAWMSQIVNIGTFAKNWGVGKSLKVWTIISFVPLHRPNRPNQMDGLDGRKRTIKYGRSRGL